MQVNYWCFLFLFGLQADAYCQQDSITMKKPRLSISASVNILPYNSVRHAETRDKLLDSPKASLYSRIYQEGEFGLAITPAIIGNLGVTYSRGTPLLHSLEGFYGRSNSEFRPYATIDEARINYFGGKYTALYSFSGKEVRGYHFTLGAVMNTGFMEYDVKRGYYPHTGSQRFTAHSVSSWLTLLQLQPGVGLQHKRLGWNLGINLNCLLLANEERAYSHLYIPGIPITSNNSAYATGYSLEREKRTYFRWIPDLLPYGLWYNSISLKASFQL
jgi:hypothetical protein